MEVERVDVYLRELLSSGLLLLHTELGVDLGLNAELLPPGLLTCVAAALGLLIALLLWVSVCRCFSNKPVEKVAAETVKTSKAKPEEVKKRNRKRGGEKKVQKNGLAVDLEAVLKPAEAQNQSESPDPAGGKGDKEKKSKKKAKAPVKETRSLSASERREPEEGTWETKVSQREKRQQRKKDKGAGDESGSPGGTELSSNAANPENTATAEEPKIISSPSVTSTNTTTRSNTASNTKTKTSNISTTSNTKTSNIKTSTKNTKTTSTTPAPKAQKNSPRSQQAVVPVEHERPVAEVTRAVIPPVSHAWDVLAVNGSGSWDLGMSVPPHSQTWNSVKSEPSVWPQDMEGSWMIVDGSHIPVSLHGIPAGVEAQVVPDRSWVCPAPVDDEWSGPNSGCVDPASDYCAPCEEWGNYEPAGGVVSPDEPQDSDLEKDKDEPAAAPGSNKAKKKKKKKKKAEETGSAAQVEIDVGVAKDQNTAGNLLPKNTKEQEIMAAPQAPLKSTELEAPPTQKKADESWESQKQVKKKKARRET